MAKMQLDQFYLNIGIDFEADDDDDDFFTDTVSTSALTLTPPSTRSFNLTPPRRN